jgi:hypothetical protein
LKFEVDEKYDELVDCPEGFVSIGVIEMISTPLIGVNATELCIPEILDLIAVRPPCC